MAVLKVWRLSSIAQKYCRVLSSLFLSCTSHSLDHWQFFRCRKLSITEFTRERRWSAKWTYIFILNSTRLSRNRNHLVFSYNSRLTFQEKVKSEHNIFVLLQLQLFAYAAREHTKAYGTTLEQYAKISHKNHKQGKNNPYASIPYEIPMKKIVGSRMICDPITLPMSTPTADGSAAAVVCSKAFMEARGLQVLKQYSLAYTCFKKVWPSDIWILIYSFYKHVWSNSKFNSESY